MTKQGNIRVLDSTDLDSLDLWLAEQEADNQENPFGFDPDFVSIF